MARLVDPASDGVRPQRLGLLGGDDDVGLGTRQPAPRFHGQRRSVGGDADPNLHGVLLGEVALSKVETGAEQLRRRPLGEEELPLDLDRHLTSMWQGALRSPR